MIKQINNLDVVEICVTSRCNLACTHCYQSREKNLYQLSLKQIQNIIIYANRLGCKKFVLSGGEFFTHPNAYSIIEYILVNTASKISIVTNSILLDINKIQQIAPTNRVSFTISIDGNQKEHDIRRGKGMFALTQNNINLLNSIGYDVNLTMTLVEKNIYCIPEVLNLFPNNKITFMPVATTGAAIINFAQEIDSEAYEQVIRHIYKTCREYTGGEHRCHLFPKGFSVKYDGSIFPCSLSRDYGLFNIGNLNEEVSIQHVIDDFLSSTDSDIFFEYNNNLQINKCNHCSKNTECPRGCRIRAYKWSKKLTEADPFACKLFNDAFPEYTFGDIYWGTKRERKPL